MYSDKGMKSKGHFESMGYKGGKGGDSSSMSAKGKGGDSSSMSKGKGGSYRVLMGTSGKYPWDPEKCSCTCDESCYQEPPTYHPDKGGKGSGKGSMKGKNSYKSSSGETESRTTDTEVGAVNTEPRSNGDTQTDPSPPSSGSSRRTSIFPWIILVVVAACIALFMMKRRRQEPLNDSMSMTV